MLYVIYVVLHLLGLENFNESNIYTNSYLAIGSVSLALVTMIKMIAEERIPRCVRASWSESERCAADYDS